MTKLPAVLLLVLSLIVTSCGQNAYLLSDKNTKDTQAANPGDDTPPGGDDGGNDDGGDNGDDDGNDDGGNDDGGDNGDDDGNDDGGNDDDDDNGDDDGNDDGDDDNEPGPGIVLDCPDVDLGNILLSLRKVVTVVVRNNSEVDAENVLLSSTDLGVVILDGAVDIKAKSHKLIKVAVLPSVLGLISKNLSLSFNANGRAGSQGLKIKGNVVALGSDTGSDVGVIRVVDGKRLNFGQVPVKSTYTKEVILVNKGTTAAMVTDIKMNLGNHYKVESDSECLGAFLGTCTLRVAFNPQTQYPRRRHLDKVLISYLGSDNSEAELKLRTNGLAITRSQCIEYNEVSIIAEDAQDVRDSGVAIDLPYKLSSPDTNAKLDLVLNTEANRTLPLLEQNVSYVHNAQVGMVFNVNSKRRAGSVVKADISLDMLKNVDTSGVSHQFTEVLCSSNAKVCSGRKFIDSEYSKLANPDFVYASTCFADTLKSKAKRVEDILALDLRKLNKTFTFRSLFKKKRKQALKSVQNDDLASFVLADDVKLQSKPVLNVRYKKIKDRRNICR